ncbi:TetR/AcrR family transcriptional regulator [Cupriavidus necator]|uniref:TetR/AcrR family transcriptional regulator n=1 Tax=Cupriavidus necator TaxID=106590 RepID=UPI0005B4E4A4|nr:TetR/AcrR family transcriptional regulator [Cupriavidus necator]
MARPRKFNEQAALTAALDAFWARGYEATSTRDLTSAMGMTQPSLYNAFGDKRSLFLLALDGYLDGTVRERIARLQASLPPAAAITAYFAESIERSLADPLHRGCLLVNTALEVTQDDPDLQQKVADAFMEIRGFFRRQFTAAQDAGEVDSRLSAEDVCAQLLAVLLGMRVLARAAPQRELLEGAVRPTLALLGLPPLSAGTG